MHTITAITVVACLYEAAPDEPLECERFDIPVAMTQAECERRGRRIVDLAMSDPYFEFHEVEWWECHPSQSRGRR